MAFWDLNFAVTRGSEVNVNRFQIAGVLEFGVQSLGFRV